MVPSETKPPKTQSAIELIQQLRAIDAQLHNHDVLLTWQRSSEELRAVLLAAEALEQLYHAGIATRVFESGLAVSIFRDQSTRTRFSFASAANLLGAVGSTRLIEQFNERVRPE